MYDVILADPPWCYKFSASRNRRVENHYGTMKLADIFDFEFESADNAVLYLWATAPKLREALQVMHEWGFEYKTHAVWDKVRIGLGYWFRGQHELLLVGVKGKFSPPEQALRVPSIITEQRTVHSKKPDAVHEMIEKAFPEARKLELFARRYRDGWTCQGDQLGKEPF